MKKAVSFTMVFVLVLSLIFSGCSSADSQYLGTWTATKAEHEGKTYTISELEGMGDKSLSDFRFVIAEDSKAYLTAEGTKMPLEWSKTDNGIKLGERELSFVDGQFQMENNGVTVFFEKTSDSQDIPTE